MVATTVKELDTTKIKVIETIAKLASNPNNEKHLFRIMGYLDALNEPRKRA